MPEVAIEEIPEELGNNFKTIMGSFAFEDSYKAIEELVKNMYDADAGKAEIISSSLPKTPQNAETLLLIDDGTGMDEEGLRNFRKFGGSPKLNIPITAKGRRVLGNLCIAKTALRNLAYVYTLETVKDNEMRSFRVAHIREIVDYSIRDNHNLWALDPIKRNQIVEDIINKIAIEEVSPWKIPEIKNTNLITQIEDDYGPLEKILNRDTGQIGSLKVNVKQVQRVSGTTIKMYPLRPGIEKEYLNIKKLKTHLQENLGELLSLDFNIHLNEKQLTPIRLHNAIAYKIDTILPKCKEIRGEIYYSAPPNPVLKFKGLHIYVDKARSGEIPGIDLGKMKFGLINRLLGKIHVDSLRDKTLLSRLDHVQDDPRIIELADYLKGVLGKIVHDANKMHVESHGKKLMTAMDSAAKKIEQNILKSGLSQATGKSKAETNQLKIGIGKSMKTGTFGRYNSDTGEILFNEERTVLFDSSTPHRLEQYFLDNSMILIAKEKVERQSPEYKEPIDIFLSEIRYLEKKIIKKSRSKALSEYAQGIGSVKISKHPDDMPISKIRMYSKSELPKITGRSNIVFTRAIESDFLENKHMWTGQEIYVLMQQLYKHLTIEEIIREYIPVSSKSSSAKGVFYLNQEKTLKRNIEQIGVEKDILEDISNNNTPFYIVSESRVNQFLETYRQRGKSTRGEEKEELIRLRKLINLIEEKTGKRISTPVINNISKNEEILQYQFRSNIDQGYMKKDGLVLAHKINTEPGFCEKYRIL